MTQSLIAATIAALLGEDYLAEVPRASAPIAEVLPQEGIRAGGLPSRPVVKDGATP